MGPRDSLPRRVVLATYAQLALMGADLSSLVVFGFGLLGATQNWEPDTGPGLVFLSWWALDGVLGLVLGVAAIVGFWRAAPWAWGVAIAHAVVTALDCCPGGWAFAVWALIAAVHPEVREWPERAKREETPLAEVFR